VGSGSTLDTLESVARIMRKMKENGYHLENLPKDGKELIANIMDRKAISEFRWTTVDEIVKRGGALALLEIEEYLEWFNTFPQDVRERILRVGASHQDKKRMVFQQLWSMMERLLLLASNMEM
jgi:cobaltochelatase CobN